MDAPPPSSDPLHGLEGRVVNGADPRRGKFRSCLLLTIEAVKVAVHPLQKRFCEAVKAEIAQTVGQAGDVRGELDALMALLRK